MKVISLSVSQSSADVSDSNSERVRARVRLEWSDATDVSHSVSGAAASERDDIGYDLAWRGGYICDMYMICQLSKILSWDVIDSFIIGGWFWMAALWYL